MKDHSLQLNGSILSGASPIMDLTSIAEDWKRSRTFTGGPWQGTFTVRGDRSSLEQLFYESLGYDVKERSFGMPSWEGMIWELDFVDYDVLGWTRYSKRGRRRRRSYEDMFNRVMVAYTEPGGAAGETSWYDDLVSQEIYGIKEEILYRDIAQAGAEEAAQEFLAMHSYPDARLIALEENVEEPLLEVTVVGYIATANFRFTQTIDDSSSTVGAWVEDIFDVDLLQFLTRSRRANNARSIDQSLDERMRALSLLENLLTLRDGSGNQFNITVEPGRLISYDVWSPTPIGYFWNGLLTTPLYDSLEARPRLIPPGIYRDMGFIPQSTPVVTTNSFFEHPQDFLLETIEIDDDGRVIPRLGVYEEEESLRIFDLEEGDA